MAEYISVSQLNRLAKQTLAGNEALSALIVCGEISNFTRHYKSRHLYFTLRDEAAAVKAVMFSDKARLLGFAPQEGMLVLAYGYATLYERDGAFQLYVEYMRPFGVGAAQQAFDALRRKLQAEGLLDPARKRPLPAMPRCVGLVTSKTGAALQDVREVIGRRWPLTKLLLAPANVQGEGAEQSIVDALRALDADGRADVILVTRGGGSRENLWVFNSERVARAAVACRRPVVSAVGHEIDYTILDYVADLRVPTPSAAAEQCVPDGRRVREDLALLQQKFQKSIQTRCEIWYNILTGVETSPAMQSAQSALAARSAQLAQLAAALHRTAAEKLQGGERQLRSAAGLAASLNPYGVLARGYAMVTDAEGTPQAVAALQAGQEITLRGDGAWADCTVRQTGRTGEDMMR